MTYANVADVAAELGRPIPTDAPTVAQWNRWLTRIENQILARIPDLADRIAAGDLTASLVGDIEATAVARKALNPEGLRSTTRAIDDGSVTKTIDQTRSAGELELTDDEWALLLPRRVRGAFTIRPEFG